jgi:hypothetical protein
MVPTEKLTEIDTKGIKGNNKLFHSTRQQTIWRKWIFYRSERTFTCCIFSWTW